MAAKPSHSPFQPGVDYLFPAFALTIQRILAATRSLDSKESGRIFIADKSSGTQVFTLDSCEAQAPAGDFFTIICGDAGGEILINPKADDTICIKASEGGANVTTTAGVGIKNTAATNVKGDRITLVSDGISQWLALEQSGIWASQ